MELTKRMRDVLAEPHGDTTKTATATKMEKLGMITVDDFWITRGGNPGMSAQGHKPGSFVIAFTVNEDHPLVIQYRQEVAQ